MLKKCFSNSFILQYLLAFQIPQFICSHCILPTIPCSCSFAISACQMLSSDFGKNCLSKRSNLCLLN